MSKSRNKEFLDTATRRVVADYTQNEPANLMERINIVNRACPGQSKQNVNYLLRTNDYDVNETVRRINEEGAKEMIGDWSKNISKKNKRKKKKDETGTQKEVPPSAAAKPVDNFDARPSSDSKFSKHIPLSNSVSPKPATAPPYAQPLPNSHAPSLPLEGYGVPYQHSANSTAYHPDSLQPNHNLLSSGLSTPSNNIQFLLLQLQTHSSQLSQWQGMLLQRMDTSLQILQYVFQQLQTSLSERHQLLVNNIENGKWKAQEIFEQRKKLAHKLTAQAKSAPDEGVAEQIKQFLADKQSDQQLCDVYSLNIDHDTLLAAVLSLGDIVNSIPQYSHWTTDTDPAAVQQHTPQQVHYKPPAKIAQPVYQVPETQPPPVQNYAPAHSYQPPLAPHPISYPEPEPELEPEEQLSEQTAAPAPEVFALTSQVYEVTLNDLYSSDAKPVDLTSGAGRHKTTEEEVTAARVRMQGMLDKQGRSMIVSDVGGKGPMGPTGKRGGEKKGGKVGGKGGPNKGRGRDIGSERRGPPSPRRDEWNNGPTYSAEYTNSNLEGDGDAWDNPPEFVPSLVLTNNNFDNNPDETDATLYNSVQSVEFMPTRHEDSSPEEPSHQPQVNSFKPPTQLDNNTCEVEQQPSAILNWDDDTVTSTDWALDHEDT